jgi:hypothetical protein
MLCQPEADGRWGNWLTKIQIDYMVIKPTKLIKGQDNKRLIQILKRKNEEIARLEEKLGQTTKLPTQDTHKPKEPSWWKDKERMDNRNKPKKPPGSKGRSHSLSYGEGYHNWAVYKPPGSKGRSHSLSYGEGYHNGKIYKPPP